MIECDGSCRGGQSLTSATVGMCGREVLAGDEVVVLLSV